MLICGHLIQATLFGSSGSISSGSGSSSSGSLPRRTSASKLSRGAFKSTVVICSTC